MAKSTFIQTTTYPAIVGAIFGSLRRERGLDQAAIAKAIGVTQSTWSRIENGASTLSLEQLRKAADAVKVPPSTVLLQAERAEQHLKQHVVRVLLERMDSPVSDGLMLLGAAALAVLVIMAMNKKPWWRREIEVNCQELIEIFGGDHTCFE